MQGGGYGDDLAINPGRNAMLTSSFTGYSNYRTDLPKLIKEPAAMQKFGDTMVLWDFKATKPQQIFSTPGVRRSAGRRPRATTGPSPPPRSAPSCG